MNIIMSRDIVSYFIEEEEALREATAVYDLKKLAIDCRHRKTNKMESACQCEYCKTIIPTKPITIERLVDAIEVVTAAINQIKLTSSEHGISNNTIIDLGMVVYGMRDLPNMYKRIIKKSDPKIYYGIYKSKKAKRPQRILIVKAMNIKSAREKMLKKLGIGSNFGPKTKYKVVSSLYDKLDITDISGGMELQITKINIDDGAAFIEPD